MTRHVSVLLDATVNPLLQALRSPAGAQSPAWVLDCTLGGGGHTSVVLEALTSEPALKEHRLLAIDRDLQAVERAKVRFEAHLQAGRLELLHCAMSEVDSALAGRRVLGIMADLGFSSDQLDDPARGFSFLSEGPLDMRMDTSRGESARDLLARAGEKDLADLIYAWGEERHSRRIARRVVEARSAGRLPSTTQGLAELVISALPPRERHGRIHGATRTFQALRIAVNGEMDELDALLERVILNLAPGGSASVISFHSLEDRRVKLAFRRLAAEDAFRVATKKPLEASEDEIRANSRARSAKLRVIDRLV